MNTRYEALKEQAEEIKKIIEAGDYDVYGLRADEKVIYDLGDICANSHQWWQDDPNPELPDDMDDEEYSCYGEPERYEYDENMQCWDGGELDGTSAIKITEESVEQAIELFKNYTLGAKQITLIAGNYAEKGNDIGEIIIRRAEVIKVI